MIFLQAQTAVDSVATATSAQGISLFDLVMKGGWVMIPTHVFRNYIFNH